MRIILALVGMKSVPTSAKYKARRSWASDKWQNVKERAGLLANGDGHDVGARFVAIGNLFRGVFG